MSTQQNVEITSNRQIRLYLFFSLCKKTQTIRRAIIVCFFRAKVKQQNAEITENIQSLYH